MKAGSAGVRASLKAGGRTPQSELKEKQKKTDAQSGKQRRIGEITRDHESNYSRRSKVGVPTFELQ